MSDHMDVAEKYRICVDALKGFMCENGFKHVVIGLSGGIDSSLVTVMATDALGSENVHGVMLPGPYSSKSSVEDAKLLSDNLGIECINMSISKSYEAFAEAFYNSTGRALEGLASENTQARCRMVCLMALSNAFGWLMLNTGNKSEAAMGYSTLYGDTAGAFAPIGGIYKTDVFALCKWRNAEAEKLGETPPIPENVLVKPPSAELSEGQSDEESMGIAYRDLDRILIACIEQGMGVDEAESAGLDPTQVEYVLKRYRAYAFKREQEPPYPKAAFYR